jgi:hypothetical protein
MPKNKFCMPKNKFCMSKLCMPKGVFFHASKKIACLKLKLHIPKKKFACLKKSFACLKFFFAGPKTSFACLKMFKKKLQVQKPNFTIQIRKFNENDFYYNFFLFL